MPFALLPGVAKKDLVLAIETVLQHKSRGQPTPAFVIGCASGGCTGDRLRRRQEEGKGAVVKGLHLAGIVQVFYNPIQEVGGAIAVLVFSPPQPY